MGIQGSSLLFRFNVLRKSAVVALMLFLIPSSTSAVDFNLTDLVGTQLNDITHTFAAAIMFKPVEPASNFGISGKKNGKRFGLGAGIQISEVTAIKMAQYYSSTVGILPAAMGVVVMGFPYGIGLEFGMWPRLAFGGLEFEEYGGNFKWTGTDLIFEDPKKRPFDAALRAGVTRAGLNYKQTVSGVPVYVDFNTTILVASASISRDFGIVEPYAGIGYFSQSSELSTVGTVSIFNASLTVSNKIEASTSHVYFYSGFMLHLLALKLSLEYNDVGGVNGYAMKFGLKF